jgi:hypothetical protein
MSTQTEKSMRRAALALMLVLLAPLAGAQGDGFAAFWKEFSAAAAKKDKDKIRALTQYPSKELEEKDFDVIWKGMFPRAMLACLAKAKPERDDKFGNYVAFCKETIYGFERTPQGWRFVGTHPND